MLEIKQLGTNVRMKLQRRDKLFVASRALWLFLGMKQVQELDNLRKRRNVQQRIVDAQTDACTKYFCTTMNRYYELVVAYQGQCKARLVRQLEIGS
jgi:t-SNARE complex subunit (syntaxin)